MTLLLFIIMTAQAHESSGVIDADLREWKNVNIEVLNQHPFFTKLPAKIKKLKSGIERREYINSVCKNVFFVNNSKVIEYRPIGKCRTDRVITGPHATERSIEKKLGIGWEDYLSKHPKKKVSITL